MKILVIGGGILGASVLRQLKLNPKFEIVVADWRKDCVAVKTGVIKKVDILAHVTPMNAVDIVEHVNPDLVLIARTQKDWKHEDTTLGHHFISNMERELSHISIPVIIVDIAMREF